MKALPLFALAAILFQGVLSPLSAGGRIDVEVGPDDGYYYNDGYYYDDSVIWIGPGVYYGVQFDNEYQFYAWRRHHRRYYRNYRRHHGGGHHHGGGGRHHGGHHGGHGHK